MKKLFKKYSIYKFEFLISFIAILFVFSPYIKPDLIIGSDTPFHLARIETLEQNLRYGIFPTKVHVDLCYGFGYGVGFFYPDFFLYIPAVLGLLGLSLEISFKIFAGIILCGIYLSVFYCVYKLTSNRYAAIASAIIFLFSNRVLGSFFYEFTLGTSLGLIFMPLAICGMYLFLTENQKPYMLGIGFTGLIFSHVLSTTLALAICLIILLVHIKCLFSSSGKIKSLISTVLLVSALTASFWIPMLEQFFAQQYHVSQPWTYVDDNVLYLANLIRHDGPGWSMNFIIFALGFWLVIEKRKIKKIDFFYFLGLILLLLPLCGPFWHLFRNAFKFLQFPKRLLLPSATCMVFAFGSWMNSFKINIRYQKYITVFILLISFYCGFNYIDSRINDMTEDFGNRILYQEIAGIGAGEEWLPLETTRDNITTPNSAVTDTGESITGIRKNQYFNFEALQTSNYYDVPFVWYKGYKALTSDGRSLPITKNPDTGITRVLTDQLSAGTTITVWYNGTPLQKASYLISLATFIFFIGFWGYKRFENRVNK